MTGNNPTADQVRYRLRIGSGALPDVEITEWLDEVNNTALPNTSDKYMILYYTCWKIAESMGWSFASRVGDRSYSAPNPETFKQQYIKRAQDVGITPPGLGIVPIHKMNSDLDDYPDDFTSI